MNVECKFKSFLELVKRVYRLDAAVNTPRKDLRSSSEETRDTAILTSNKVKFTVILAGVGGSGRRSPPAGVGCHS